ncbi:hypothetical protein [Halobacteriovorax sp.]|uniref:hypothetical protein n=1 Tax=Halobacteriovorax sp. TaxID=2020862 RepID=UPI003AF2D7C4
MKIVSLTSFLLLFGLSSFANESGVIYRHEKIQIEYDRNEDKFIFKNGNFLKEYPRFRYRDMILEKFIQVPSEDRQKLEERLKLIKNTYRMGDAAPEEVLSSALSDFETINNAKDYDCGDSRISINEESPDFVVDMEIPKIELKKDSFLGLGELQSAEFELNTSNDNPLHGALMFVGVTEYEKRDTFEGDDRGLTFGAKPSARFKYENGELSISYSSKVYTKLVSKPCGIVEIGGLMYQRHCYQNEDGTWNQEALNRDDLDIKVYRRIGDDKSTFVEVGVGITTFDDKGLAASTQRGWHELTQENGTVQYENVEHMERVMSPKANIRIGKIIDLTDPDNKVSLSSEVYTGGQVSYIGGNENFISIGGDLKIKINNDDKSKFPIVETRFYYDAQITQLNEVNENYGVEARANLYERDKSRVFLKVGMGVEDDYYNRLYELYGQSFVDDRLDLQHYLGIGFEQRF